MIGRFFYKIRILLYVIGVIVVLAGALGLSYVIYMHYWCNFHTVTPGKFYRSGQMDHRELIYYLKEYKIKSVVNLEGANPTDAWYKDEIKVCKELGVKHFNVALSSSHIISIKETIGIIVLLKGIPKPILVHCNGGADRSGFVSAIWNYAIMGEGSEKAIDQLSWKYFHLPYLGNPTIAMNKSFWMYVNYADKNGQAIPNN
jgi:hypothetical protein